MPPKKPTLSRPSRPTSGTAELEAAGSALSLKVPSPPPDRPVGDRASALATRTSGGVAAAASGTARRAGSRARRLHWAEPARGEASAAVLTRPGAVWETALRPGVAAALATRTPAQLWAGPTTGAAASTATPNASAATTTATASGASASVGSAVRVNRLLRDARASVRAPARPETPIAYLQPGPVRRRSSAALVAPRPPPGRRLAALTPLNTAQVAATASPASMSAAGVSPSSAAVAAVVRNSQLVPEELLAQLIQSEGHEAVQTALLRELDRWLSNPTNRVWPELIAYFGDFLHTAVAYPSADRRADTAVGVLMGGIILRSSPDILHCPALAPLTRLLRTEVQSTGSSRATLSVSDLLEKESLFEPLFYVLRQCCGGGGAGVASGAEPALADAAAVASLLEAHTSVALDVLEVLRGCTTTYRPEPSDTPPDASPDASPESAASVDRRRRSSSHSQWPPGATRAAEEMEKALETDQAAWRQQQAQADRLCELLATSGVLPTLNTLLRSVLQLHQQSPETDLASGMLLPSVCLLLRNLARSPRQAGHLCRLGTLELLLQVLETYTEDVYIMEAVSRALAKLVFVPECLIFYQQNTRLVTAAVAVLLTHTAPISQEALLTGSGSGTLSAHVKVLVARLCSTIARVAEGHSAQLDAVAEGCADALLPRLVDYFISQETVAVLRERQLGDEDDKARASAGPGDTTSTCSSSHDTSRVSAGLRRRRPSLDAQYSEGLTDTSLLEGVVWLVGLVAMSAACTPHFVRATAPALTDLLKALEFGPSTRLTCVYTLMSLSNLSYYFASIEQEDQVNRSRQDDDAEKAMHEGDAAADDDDPEEVPSRDVPSPFLSQLYEVLGLCLAGFLFEGDAEATVEATRVLGNMSYTNTGRDWMETNRCDEVMVIFLGHEDLRVVYNCFGVLLNLTAASHCRAVAEPELLRMLLQSTGRYTRREDIDTAAKEEKRQLLEAALGGGASDAEENDDVDDPEAMGGPRRGDRRWRRPLLTEREARRLAELEAQELATGYAAQIAELVEKVLENVHGLLLGTQSLAA